MEEHLVIEDRSKKLGELWWYEPEDEWRASGYLLFPQWRGLQYSGAARPRAKMQFTTERFRFRAVPHPQAPKAFFPGTNTRMSVAGAEVYRVGAYNHNQTMLCTLDLASCAVSDVSGVEHFEFPDVGMMLAMAARYCELWKILGKG